MENPRYVLHHPGFSALRAGMTHAQVIELLGEPRTRSDRNTLEPLSPAQKARLHQEQNDIGRALSAEFAKPDVGRRLEELTARRQKIHQRLARSIERWEFQPPGWVGSIVLTFDEKGKLRTFECGMG